MDINSVKLQEEGVLINGNVTLPDGNTGHVQYAYQKWLAEGNKPAPQYSDEALTRQNEQQAKANRDSALSADLMAFSVTWQVSNDAMSIRHVLSDALLVGMASTDTVPFRLADNTWRETSLDELQQILQTYIMRKQSIWAQYEAWDDGDKRTEFIVSVA